MISKNNIAKQPSGLSETLRFLESLAYANFYGIVEVRFEAGNVVHLTEIRSMKPYSLAIPETLESNFGTEKQK